MCLLQLPESWHEACTTSVNLALAGLFKHPLNSHGFVLGKGKSTNIDVPGASPNSTQPSGINPQGDIVGSYADSSGKAHGFLLRAGIFSTIDVPGAAAVAGGTTAAGINPQGDIVGNFGDANFNAHGFLLKNGRFTTIDVPGTACGPNCFLGTFANGINPQGDIVGYYNGGDGHVHGFLLRDGTFSTIDPPGSSFTQAWGSTRKATSWGITLAATVIFMVFC